MCWSLKKNFLHSTTSGEKSFGTKKDRKLLKGMEGIDSVNEANNEQRGKDIVQNFRIVMMSTKDAQQIMMMGKMQRT